MSQPMRLSLRKILRHPKKAVMSGLEIVGVIAGVASAGAGIAQLRRDRKAGRRLRKQLKEDEMNRRLSTINSGRDLVLASSATSVTPPPARIQSSTVSSRDDMADFHQLAQQLSTQGTPMHRSLKSVQGVKTVQFREGFRFSRTSPDGVISSLEYQVEGLCTTEGTSVRGGAVQKGFVDERSTDYEAKGATTQGMTGLYLLWGLALLLTVPYVWRMYGGLESNVTVVYTGGNEGAWRMDQSPSTLCTSANPSNETSSFAGRTF